MGEKQLFIVNSEHHLPMDSGTFQVQTRDKVRGLSETRIITDSLGWARLTLSWIQPACNKTSD